MKTRIICLLACAVMAHEVSAELSAKILSQGGKSTYFYFNSPEDTRDIHKVLPDVEEGYKSILIEGNTRWATKLSINADDKYAKGLSSLEEIEIDNTYLSGGLTRTLDNIDIKGDNIKRIVLPKTMIRLRNISIDSSSFEGFDISGWSVVGAVRITGATNNITMPSKMHSLISIIFKDCDIETLRIESDRLGTLYSGREHLRMTIRDSYIGELDAPDRIYDKISIDVFGPNSRMLNPVEYFGAANPILIKVVGDHITVKWRKGIEIETKFGIDGDWRDFLLQDHYNFDRRFMSLWRYRGYNQFFRIKPEENNPVLIQADIIPEK